MIQMNNEVDQVVSDVMDGTQEPAFKTLQRIKNGPRNEKIMRIASIICCAACLGIAIALTFVWHHQMDVYEQSMEIVAKSSRGATVGDIAELAKKHDLCISREMNQKLVHMAHPLANKLKIRE